MLLDFFMYFFLYIKFKYNHLYKYPGNLYFGESIPSSNQLSEVKMKLFY